jgi:hypothetical protein
VTTLGELVGDAVVWRGVLRRALMPEPAVAAGHRLADAARAGDWSAVMKILDDEKHWVCVNQWRPGGAAWRTPLHHAARRAAPVEVVEELLHRGALRSLRDAKGRKAHDLVGSRLNEFAKRSRRRHLDRLRDLLWQRHESPFGGGLIEALDVNLATVIDGCMHEWVGIRDFPGALRYPPVEILHEPPGQQVWFRVPYTHGGFHIALVREHLVVTSGKNYLAPPDHVYQVTLEGAVRQL